MSTIFSVRIMDRNTNQTKIISNIVAKTSEEAEQIALRGQPQDTIVTYSWEER